MRATQPERPAHDLTIDGPESARLLLALPELVTSSRPPCDIHAGHSGRGPADYS